MKHLRTILGGLIIAFLITSCSNNETNEPLVKSVESKSIENLHAPGKGRGNYTGPFTKFSFSEGKQVTGDNWDIAFRATEIIINGGEKGALLEDIDRVHSAALVLKTGTFASIKEAPTDSEFKQDKKDALALLKGSGNGWYTYDSSNHTISPAPGKVLVIKTHNGHYAKVEISSYYKDKKPSHTSSQYFTFKYVYNPNKGDKSFQ